MNLADPLTLDDGAVQLFVRDNRCGICLGHLVYDPMPDRRWTVRCPVHGSIYETSAVSFWDMQGARQEIEAGKMAMRQAKLARKSNLISTYQGVKR